MSKEIGKIYRLNTGPFRLVTVHPSDEEHFREQLLKRGISATEVLNHDADYDTIIRTTVQGVENVHSNEYYAQPYLATASGANMTLASADREIPETDFTELYEQGDPSEDTVWLEDRNEEIPDKLPTKSNIAFTREPANLALLDRTHPETGALIPPEYDKNSVAPSSDVATELLGSGYDFAGTTPSMILTIQNAPDYFNLRTETHLYHTQAPHVFTEYTHSVAKDMDKLDGSFLVVKASDPIYQPGGDLYDNPNYQKPYYNEKTEQWEFSTFTGSGGNNDTGALYAQNSGYLPYFTYGDKSTWDEATWLWNKEVKDKIYAGTHGYNPYTDELFELETPIAVDPAYQIYANKQNLIYADINFEKFKNEFYKVEEVEYPSISLSTGDKINYTVFEGRKKTVVDELSELLYGHGFEIYQQTGLYQKVEIYSPHYKQWLIDNSDWFHNRWDAAEEMATLTLPVNFGSGDISEMKKVAQQLNDFIKTKGSLAHKHLERGDDMLAENMLEFIKPDPWRIQEYTSMINAAFDRLAAYRGDPTAEVDMFQHRPDITGSDPRRDSDKQIFEGAYRYYDGRLTYWEDGAMKFILPGVQPAMEFVAEQGQEYDTTVTLALYKDFNRPTEGETWGYMSGAPEVIEAYEKNYSEYYINNTLIPKLLKETKYKDSVGYDSEGNLVKMPWVIDSDIEANPEYQDLFKALVHDENHQKDKREKLTELWVRYRSQEYMFERANEEASEMSSNIFTEGILQTETLKDVKRDITQLDKDIVNYTTEIEVLTKNIEDMYSTALEIEMKLFELGFGDPNVGVLGKIGELKEKYNITTNEEFQNNSLIKEELREWELEVSSLLSQYNLLTSEAIPATEKILGERFEQLDTANYSLENWKLMQNILERDHEPGTYYPKKLGISIFNTLYGGVAKFGASMSHLVSNIGGFKEGSLGYSGLKWIEDGCNRMGDDVAMQIEEWNETLSLPTEWGDIEDFSDGLDYLFTGLTDNLPILVAAYVSRGYSLRVMGTYAFSEKYDFMRREDALFAETGGAYGQDFKFYEILLNASVTGATEALFEKLTFGQWKRLGYVFGRTRHAKLGFKKGLRANYGIGDSQSFINATGYYSAYFTKNVIEEGTSELLTQFSSNVMDVWSGVEGAHWADGLDEAFVNGMFLSGFMHAGPVFKSMVINPFLTKDANQIIGELYEKTITLEKRKEQAEKDGDTDKVKKIDEEILKTTLKIEDQFKRELFKVDLMSNEDKRILLDIHKADHADRLEAEKIMRDDKISHDTKIAMIMHLEQGVADRKILKHKILAKVNPEEAEKQYKKSMANMNNYITQLEEEGNIETEILETKNEDEYTDDLITETQGEGTSREDFEDIVAENEAELEQLNESKNEADNNVNNAKQEINNIENESNEIINEAKDKKKDLNNENIKLKEENSKKIDEINTNEKFDDKKKETEINKVNKETNTKVLENNKEIKKQENIIKDANKNKRTKKIEQNNIIKNETKKSKAINNRINRKNGILKRNVNVGGSILKENPYGRFKPVYGKDASGNTVIKKMRIVINKKKAIEDGMWATAAHELTHAIFANTLKANPRMRVKLGGALNKILSGNNLEFKTLTAQDMFNKRVSQYGIDKQGEEALAIISEMLATGDVRIKENAISRIGSVFRRWSQEKTGYAFNFDNTGDVLNYIKDYHHSLKNNKVNKSILAMMAKGARGKMFQEAKTPEERKNLNMHSLAVEKNLKSNPDLRDEFDDLVMEDDGSRKHKNNNEFKASPEYVEGYSKIVDSKLLNGLIQVGMVERGLPPEALKDFTRKVKEEIGLRYLNNYNLDKNNSLFGWLAGISGGAGRSIIYRAKGDVINQYLKEEARTSIDKVKDETGKIADTIQAEKDVLIDQIENADMSPSLLNESIQDINDLIMAMDMLGLPNNVKQAVKQVVKKANIPLDGLTYKGVRDLLLSTQSKATTEKNVIPTGPLFEVLNAISAEFGVDPLRILAKQDLNAEQRKAAQEYIYTKSINEDGSFNTGLLDVLPEGQDRDGRATGVANTKLGEFYTKGERLKVKEGAKKGLGQKFAQNKRTNITKEEFLDLFGINADGTFQPGTKADGAIRELVVQVSQLAANQEIRLDAIENRIEAADNIARLKDGTSLTMYSNPPTLDSKQKVELAKQLYDKNSNVYAENIPTIRIQKLEHVLKHGDDIKKLEKKRKTVVDYDAPSPFNPDITTGEQLRLDVDNFLKQYPQYYDQLRNTMTGGIGLSTFFSVENFEQMFPREKYELGGLWAQQSLPRNSYTHTSGPKKRRFNPKVLNKKDDSKQRLDMLYNFAKAMEGYLKTNKNPKPGHVYLFSLMASDTVNNQNGGITRILSPFSFYTIMKNGKEDTTNVMTEEHAGPQKRIMDMLVNAARVGQIDTVWPIVEAIYAQGPLLEIIDKRLKDVKNKDGKNLQENLPDIFWDNIAERIFDGKLDDLPQGMVAMVRYAVAGKTLGVDLINTIKWKNGKTLAENFDVKIDGKITEPIFQFQYDLMLGILSGTITKEQAAAAIDMLNIEGINSIENIKETVLVRNDLVVLNNNNDSMLSKPIEIKGMSTFDFDDTLARTKSGVRYTMPNNTGAPASGRKVIFLAGSAGSGKSNVVKQLGLKDQGFKVVNQDIALEWLVKNSGLPTDMRDFTPEQASKWGELQWEARDIAQRKAIKFRGRGDGVVVDGTGASTISLFTQAQKYKDAGYDVQMLFVESSLETALARNKARKERSLKDFIVERNWNAVQKNKKAFKEEFGNNFAEVNTDNLKQGDPMPNDLVVNINNFTSGYIKGRLTAEEFATQGGALLDEGAIFDFSEFNKVVDGTPGPLLEKARKRAKKFGTKDMFVLTARPQQSAFAIQQFLKGQGLDIPLKNITGLANSSGNAKAQWMLDKFAEGYNDMYFVDDALQNVEAVKNVLDQLDIKSKVVQAKLKENGKIIEPGNDTMYSKVIEPDINLDKEINNILERKKGIDANKRFSAAEARKRGSQTNITRFLKSLYIPPSAEDFKGLLYYFIGKGKQGEADMRWFTEKLLKPFAKGIRSWNAYKQNMVNEYSDLKKKFPDVNKNINKKVPGTSFTNDTAIRVYLWTKAGFDIPGISKTLQNKLVAHVNNNPNIKAFADGLSIVTRRKDGYVKPSENWVMESIPTDLRNVVDKIGRREFLQEWIDNKNIILSPENINKIEALYGASFKSALEDILYRMEYGGNRKQGKSKLVNMFTDWINGSVGAIMFFNTRSALLQTMSIVNFINWHDNNIFKASAAFANQPQFWKDFVMLFNSPMLKQRRKGLQTDVSAAELTKSFKERGYSPTTVISYLLQKGFLPTQIADSFAIAFGGASLYRNRYNKYIKQGMSPKKAHDRTMLEFQEIAEETQQSSREDLISQQQASVLGRLILAFQNVTMQYGRLNKKALSDLVNRRGDIRTNVSKIIFYGVVNNIIFSALQNALAFLIWGDEEEEIKDKTTSTLNSALDSFLRGTGIYGAIVSTIKNTVIQWDIQSKKPYGKDRPEKIILELVNLSPPVGSKIRKIVNAYYAEKYNKGLSEELGLRIENPTIEKWANIIEAATNIPIARLINKANNLEEAITGQHEMWKRLAMFLGWNGWTLGIEDEDVEEAKKRIQEKKEIEKEKEKEEKKKEKEQEKIEQEKAEEEEKKRKGIKTVRCSGIRSNGERCNMTTETAEKSWKCVHHMDFTDGMDRDNDGIKEYRCTFIKKNGDQCKMKGEYGEKKRCYHHVDK